MIMIPKSARLRCASPRTWYIVPAVGKGLTGAPGHWVQIEHDASGVLGEINRVATCRSECDGRYVRARQMLTCAVISRNWKIGRQCLEIIGHGQRFRIRRMTGHGLADEKTVRQSECRSLNNVIAEVYEGIRIRGCEICQPQHTLYSIVTWPAGRKLFGHADSGRIQGNGRTKTEQDQCPTQAVPGREN